MAAGTTDRKQSKRLQRERSDSKRTPCPCEGSALCGGYTEQSIFWWVTSLNSRGSPSGSVRHVLCTRLVRYLQVKRMCAVVLRQLYVAILLSFRAFLDQCVSACGVGVPSAMGLSLSQLFSLQQAQDDEAVSDQRRGRRWDN